ADLPDPRRQRIDGGAGEVRSRAAPGRGALLHRARAPGPVDDPHVLERARARIVAGTRQGADLPRVRSARAHGSRRADRSSRVVQGVRVASTPDRTGGDHLRLPRSGRRRCRSQDPPHARPRRLRGPHHLAGRSRSRRVRRRALRGRRDRRAARARSDAEAGRGVREGVGVARGRDRALLRTLRHRLRARGCRTPVRGNRAEGVPAGTVPGVTFDAMAAPLAWLIVAASAAVAIWLFLLKVRPPRVSVPSLLLWTRVLNESREQTLWERIRRAVSLALTAVIAAALALAFTQPSRQPRGGATGVTGRRVLLVVDSSWSMLARTRSGETRWDRAIAEARRLASAGSRVQIALATTADGPVPRPTADPPLIDTALDRLGPAGSAGSGWPRLSGAEVHFLTDGAVARALDPGVVIHSVYEAAPNAGITAFDVRAPLDAASTDEAYLEVVNFGPAQQVHLTVNRGSTALLDRRVDMGAGEALHQVVRLPHGGAPDLHARIDADNDALSSDNDAFGWIQSAKPLTVAVVSDQPAWLAPWFAANADVHATFVAPADYRSGDEDVVLFDRWAPQAPAAKPALYVAPPGTAWLGSANQVELRPQWTTVGLHPLL